MALAGGTCICKKTYSTTIEDTEPVIGNLVAPWKQPLQKRVDFFIAGLRIAIGLVPVSANQNSLIRVTQQAGVGTIKLPEPLRHLRIGDIVNLMGAGAEEKSVYDSWHVTGDTATTFRVRSLPGVRRQSRAVVELGVTRRTHMVRLITNF